MDKSIDQSSINLADQSSVNRHGEEKEEGGGDDDSPHDMEHGHEVAVTGEPHGRTRRTEKVDDHIVTEGFMKSLSGSRMVGPGINLEVQLGHAHSMVRIVGPTSGVSRSIEVEGAEPTGPAELGPKAGAVTQAKPTSGDDGISSCPPSLKKSKGKQKIKYGRRSQPDWKDGPLYGLAKDYGHNGASSSKPIKKSVQSSDVSECTVPLGVQAKSQFPESALCPLLEVSGMAASNSYGGFKSFLQFCSAISICASAGSCAVWFVQFGVCSVLVEANLSPSAAGVSVAPLACMQMGLQSGS
ncbi:hypothetical protein LOK49_LG10G01248 [Camellia lanceoleosa]|uniref:Uncharacterized protein n=1 Tax=Camellia lanceoleosa TaxID=1840588 RepID=A0ACC0GD85_9ERIC|nr:hypothetical protein LOK49_LG10G01248 [Camellia lanceoleosa]